MKNMGILGIVLLIAAGLLGGYFLFGANKDQPEDSPSSSVTIEGGDGGTQEIDAGQQNGGAAIEGDVGTVVVENDSLVNTNCSHPAQKNFGLLERNGYHGPMCKKRLATRIKAKNCAKKQKYQHQGLCIMEWEGTQWRVRPLK